ncbi:MAG: hypothetical protein V7K89_08375 [Nostoc sp.]|uniref:hypothetical protein n=1 Tax=Nostoc sp. TaxID=1180 RepID=UPI002FF7D6C2
MQIPQVNRCIQYWGHQVEFIKWLLSECIHDDYLPEDLITNEAIAFLAERLTTPLQIEHYLQRAFEDAYQATTKPVTQDRGMALCQITCYGIVFNG